ncbi:Ig-like domain-containing protein [Nocardia sp. CA-151230]|uniref:Ig-like domain-containing protein n=1 Tax=Nocardia sp. CA-151230 TaxID=3239982 RepID=UPI003D8EDDB5
MRNTPPRISARRAGVGITGFAALAAAAVVAAPVSLAAVDTVSIDQTNPVVDKAYTISATLSGASIGLLVYFSDNGNEIGPPKIPSPPGHASISWRPTTSGQHVITASQGPNSQSIVVQVADAPLGSGSSSTGSGFGPAGPLGSGSSGTTPN